MREYNKANISLAKTLRKNMTPWERKLWYEFLRTYPIRNKKQKAIGNYVVDFYSAKARLVIELDGGGHYTELQRIKDEISSATHFMENNRKNKVAIEQSLSNLIFALDSMICKNEDW